MNLITLKQKYNQANDDLKQIKTELLSAPLRSKAWKNLNTAMKRKINTILNLENRISGSKINDNS